MYWVLAILALGFLIIVHEAGHYFVARWCKMRVERFSIGFGPGIITRRSKKTGTLFQITPIPLGGFVEIRGMNIAEEVDPDDKAAYPNRPAWQRFVTIFAGPATNYLSAIILCFFVYSCWGMRSKERWYGVREIEPGVPAEKVLQPDDRILSVDGVAVWDNSPEGKRVAISDVLVRDRPSRVTVKIRRAGVVQDVVVDTAAFTPFLSIPIEEVTTYRMGIGLHIEHDRVDVGIGTAAIGAIRYPVDQTRVILSGLADVVSGDEELDPGTAPRIATELKKAFEAGWVVGIQLLMVLSVYIGMFNLFPLPALDGGRLVFLIYEMVTRRRANPRIESTVHMVGILLLLVLMVLVLFRDIRGCIVGAY
jgi:regulator of sigma E protease